MTALPPLNALRAFDAVMRARSFRAAADDLRVSPQAVSQQVRHLEQVLGVTLFERRNRAVEPTEAAVLLAHHVAAGFAEFAEGVSRVTGARRRERINLNVSPWFATHYLLPRLSGFRDLAPQADLRLTTMVDLPDFGRDEVDVAIQWGFGAWPEREVHLLVRDPKIICCRPEIGARIAGPADLAGMTLLHSVASAGLWPVALRHLGVRAPVAAGDVAFQDAETMRRATLAGLGVGLVSRLDALADLRAGRLVAPLGEEALAGLPEAEVPGFYLVLPRAHRRVRLIAVFCGWILGEDWVAPDDLP